MSKYQRKNLLKCTLRMVIAKQVDFGDLVSRQQFSHSKRVFLAETMYITEKFYILWE